MPLPNPGSDESREDWMGRCMGNEAMRAEFPEQEQRAAVCMQKWQDRDEKAQEKSAQSIGREIGTKSLGTQLEFTDDEKGEVRAIVYTLGVVDRDREVFLKGFSGEKKVKLSRYAHDLVRGQVKGDGSPIEPPVGKGVVFVNAANEIEFRGSCFMSTTRGRDAYFTAKEMGSDQEWSVTFFHDKGEAPDPEWRAKGARVIHRGEIEPFEVSPVTVAGGIGTRTLGVKEAAELAAATAEAAASAEAAAEAAAQAEASAAAAETARLEIERQAAEEAEKKRQEEEAAELARRAEAEEIRAKERSRIDREVFEQTQRALAKMRLSPP